MQLIYRERLPNVDAVRQHLWKYRDILRRCAIGFSGGKESVVLAKLVGELADVPLVYAYCPELEFRCHVDFLSRFTPVLLDVGIGWEWLSRHRQYIFPESGAIADRWAKRHHRDPIRKWCRDRELILLWGNRTKDGNTVPAVRYRPKDGTELWMPLRDLGDQEVKSILSDEDWSPLYSLPAGKETGTCTVRTKRRGMTASESLDVVRQYEPRKWVMLKRILDAD